MIKIPLLIITLILTVPIALGNGAGNYVQKTANGLLFEFGMEPKEPKADERVIMSLSVHNSSTKEPLDIESLWIRITKGNEILFTSGDFRIKKEGPLFFGYMFKESGTYTIDFSAKHKGKDVKTSFPVSVEKVAEKAFKNFLIFAILFVLGYAASSLFNKLKRKLFKKPKSKK